MRDLPSTPTDTLPVVERVREAGVAAREGGGGAGRGGRGEGAGGGGVLLEAAVAARLVDAGLRHVVANVQLGVGALVHVCTANTDMQVKNVWKNEKRRVCYVFTT